MMSLLSKAQLGALVLAAAAGAAPGEVLGQQMVPPSAGAPKAASPAAGELILGLLRGGGHVIYVRHALADVGEDARDQNGAAVAGFWRDCALQRRLNPGGRALARQMGFVLAGLKIPIERVQSGELCRVKETAEALGLGAVELRHELNDYNTWKAQGREVSELLPAYRKMLSQTPSPGTNLLLVSHVQLGRFAAHPALELLEMGGAAVFKPAPDGSAQLVAVLHSSDWARLGVADPPSPR